MNKTVTRPPDVHLNENHEMPVVEGWEAFERWALLNSALWQLTARQAGLLPEVAFLRLVAARLLTVNEHLTKELVEAAKRGTVTAAQLRRTESAVAVVTGAARCKARPSVDSEKQCTRPAGHEGEHAYE